MRPKFAFTAIILFLNICLLGQPGPFSSFNASTSWNPEWNNNDLVQLGLFPVTLTGAIPNDDIDDTGSLNLAIEIARDYRMVCYLPAGQYDISDQILAMLPSYWTGNKWHIKREYSPSIVGEVANGGVLIKVAQNAIGFTTSGSPYDSTVVAAIQLWVQPTTGCQSIDDFPPNPPSPADSLLTIPTDPDKECQGNAFNLALKNITIDLNGNANAVGVRAAGAQGCTIENVTVLANGAYAGFQNGFAEGGGMFNIKVDGGKYGLIITDGEQGYNFHIAGGRFYNQTDAVFRGNSWAPSTFSGIHIIKHSPTLFSSIPSNPDPNLDTAKGGPPYNRGLSIIDAVVDITNTFGLLDEVFYLHGRHNFYLKNVFVRGALNVVGWSGAADEHKSVQASKFMHIEEYTHTKNTDPSVFLSLLEGNQSVFDSIKVGAYVDDPFIGRPIEKHIWLTEPILDPNNLMDDVLVIDTTIGRDLLSDDVAIQQAIDAAGTSGKVFLPRGRYIIDKPLMLHANTQLFGMDKMTTVIEPSSVFPNSPDIYFITTVNDPTAKTSFSNIMLKKDQNHGSSSFVNWQAGRNSVLRNIMLGGSDTFAYTDYDGDSRMYKIDGNGGGRWYAIAAEWEKLKTTTIDPGFTMVEINNNLSPISMYGLNTERSSGDYQVVLDNAKDVRIFHYKTEAGGVGSPVSTPLLIKNSDNIEVHTVFGLIDSIFVTDNSGTTPLPIVKIEQEVGNCITLTNISSIRSERPSSFYNVIETDRNGLTTIPKRVILGTFKSCSESVLECGLIKNYTFEDGLNYFQTNVSNEAVANFTTENDYLKIDIQDGSDAAWKVNFQQHNIFLEMGKTYRINFSAKSDKLRDLRVNLANYEGGFTLYGFTDFEDMPVNLWQDYSFDVTMNALDDPLATLQFGVGNIQINILLFRNICVEELTCRQELILNEEDFGVAEYKAANTIESISKLRDGASVYYSAGSMIRLMPTFEVEQNAVFVAEIISCL